MKKITLTLIASLFTASSFAADLKIAVLNQDIIMSDSEIAIEISEQMRNEVKDEDLRIKALEKQISEGQKEIESNKDVLTEAEIQEAVKKLQAKDMERSQLIQSLQQFQSESQQRFIKDLGPVFSKAVNEISEEMGLDLVVSKGTVLFAKDELDISQKVLARFNELVKEAQK